MLPSAFSFKGKDPVCVGHCGVRSWDFKGQQISAGGFTSDRGREKETKEITSAWECVYGLLVILTLQRFSSVFMCTDNINHIQLGVFYKRALSGYLEHNF